VCSSDLGIAFDMDNRRLWFSKNGSWVYSGNPSTGSNQAVSFISTHTHYTPYIAFDNVAGTQIFYTNFGQNPTFSGNTTAGTYTDSNGKGLFKYQPPAGFLALCEDNLPTPAISDPGKHFKTVLWTGNGTGGRSITGVGFQPDLVWIKNRNTPTWYVINDSVRGANKALYSNQTYAENQTASNPVLSSLLSFDNDGFSLAVDPDTNGNSGWNNSGDNLVAWCWKAGNTTTTNTNGSIASQVSANQDAGFSIVSFTMNPAVGTYTIGHGLGKTPKFIITKQRNEPYGWWTQHASLGSDKYLALNETNAAATLTWGGSPNNSTFTINNSFAIAGTPVIAYCWAEIEGFSKFGSYVGNGSADGPFVYCGFKPAFILIKSSSASYNWYIIDNARSSTNPANSTLAPNTANIEDNGWNGVCDLLSNGFKIRESNAAVNGSGETYIFAAFAESPFQTANAK
jgi:hypothetical protein